MSEIKEDTDDNVSRGMTTVRMIEEGDKIALGIYVRTTR